MDLLEWAEKAGQENLKGRLDNMVALKKECLVTLTVLLAGATGGLAYAVRGLDQCTPWMLFGAGCFSAFLYLVCAFVVSGPMKVRDFPALHNTPLALYQPKHDLDALRVVELRNLDVRCAQASAAIDHVAAGLNRARWASLLSPIVFIAAAAWGPDSFLAVAGGSPAAAWVLSCS